MLSQPQVARILFVDDDADVLHAARLLLKQRHQHNISRAAEALGLTRTSLYRRMEKYGL